MRIYIGYDARDHTAFEVCAFSITRRASIPVEIIPLKDWELRAKNLYRRSYRVDAYGQRWDDRDGKPFSTDFSFARFAVPILEDYQPGPVLFCDPDMLFLADVAELVELYDASCAVQCVKHNHVPKETIKAVGIQQGYARKNWSSLMLLNPSRCRTLTRYQLNHASGSWLHAMCWAGADDEIGGLPAEWNWLEGEDNPDAPKNVIHYTRGTPDFTGYEYVDCAELWREELACMRGQA